MAVQEQTPYIEHVANGVTTSFALEFECKDKEHLIVLVDNVEPNVGTWSLANGSVVFGIAPADGKIISIQRNTPFRRDTNFQSYDNSLRPATINKDFDWIWYKLQELGVADWILGNRIDALKNYVDDRDDELRAYLMEEIRKQGVALDQLDEYYNYLMQRLAQIAVDNGWDASFVVDASGKTQQQINDSSIYSVGSVAAMLGLAEGLKNRIVQVKATGAMYQYDAAQSNINDGVYVLNGWVLIGYHDVLLATLAGINGDGTNEYTKLKALLDVASTLNRPVNICGLTIHASSVVATGDIKLIGSGGIKLFAGSNGTLLTSVYNLEIDGDIALDQDKVNNSGGTITGESHCTIKHSGDSLILRNGVVVKPSASNNIVSRAKKSLILEDIDVDGGQICVYAIAPLAKVTMRGGSYKNSNLYDNIALYNAEDVSISGVTSKDSTRSGIVVNNTSKKSRIIGNLCFGNKRDGSNQGGWGIVCSVNALDTVVNSNVCLGNQTGAITLDTFPAQGVESLDNRITVTGNTINGLYAGTYSTTGISLNDATHAVVTGNSIYKVAQGIAADSANYANITGNTIQDVTAYFVQLYRSSDSVVTGNLFDGCSNTTGGAISFADSSGFNFANNTVVNLTGGAGNAVRVSGTCVDWNISNNKITRSVAGSGFAFHILGAANIGGTISGNTVKSTVSDAWQWNIVSDNAAQFSTSNNTFNGVGTGASRYAFQCNNATMGDDTVNGLRNFWTAEPTFKSRTGQVAVIAGALKYWNGTAWA